jgi:hypothetical protein
MSAWGWIDRASRVMKGADDPLAPFPNVKRWFTAIDGRPAVARARAVGKDHEFKKVNDEETKRALFPSNYPATDSQAAAGSHPVAIAGMETITARHFPTPGMKPSVRCGVSTGTAGRATFAFADLFLC